jgi:hypothetical protein
MAQSACFVSEMDFTVPKVIVEKAQQVMSQHQQDCKRASSTSPKVPTKTATPDKSRRIKAGRCPTSEAAPQLVPRAPSLCLPALSDSFRTFTPALRVRGLFRPNDYGRQPSPAAAHPTSPVCIVHAGTCSQELKVEGMQLLHEPLWSVDNDIELKGLVCNHAHKYLVPRNPEVAPIPVLTPSRRERTFRLASPAAHGSPGTPPVGEHTPTRLCAASRQRKAPQMVGWDQIERGQIPAVSAFHEGTVKTEAFVSSGPEFTEIWDYMGQV